MRRNSLSGRVFRTQRRNFSSEYRESLIVVEAFLIFTTNFPNSLIRFNDINRGLSLEDLEIVLAVLVECSSLEISSRMINQVQLVQLAMCF